MSPENYDRILLGLLYLAVALVAVVFAYGVAQ